MVTYDLRIQWLRQWMNEEVLKRFSPPKDVDLKTTLQDTVERINSGLPHVKTREEFTNYLALTLKNMQVNSRTRTLPILRDIDEAVRAAIRATNTNAPPISSKPSARSWAQIAAIQIKKRNMIPETWLTPNSIDTLMRETDLTVEDIRAYLPSYMPEGGH